MMMKMRSFVSLCLLLLSASVANGFAPAATNVGSPLARTSPSTPFLSTTTTTKLNLSSESNDDDQLSVGDQQALGIAGTLSALIVFVSEFTLFKTGCGLPAGPFGLFGLAEGISYLGVVGIGGYSAYTKVKTGSGLPAGPAGLLGAAEGLSFLAIVAGLVVLALQVTSYGYIPNAVPMEGGMCS